MISELTNQSFLAHTINQPIIFFLEMFFLLPINHLPTTDVLYHVC